MKNKKEEIKKILASMDEEKESVESLREYTYNVIDSMRISMSYMMDDFYSYMEKHNEGHLPKVSSVEQMSKAVKVLGLEDEYEVQKKYIFADLTKKADEKKVSLKEYIKKVG